MATQIVSPAPSKSNDDAKVIDNHFQSPKPGAVSVVDAKTDPLAIPVLTRASAVSAPLSVSKTMSSFTGGLKAIKSKYQRTEVDLISLATLAGSTSATAYPTTTITVSGAQDWSNYQGVYDLYRVKSVEVYAAPNQASGFTGYVAAGPYWGLAWDPSNSGAYSTPADVLTADKKLGPISCNAAASTSVVGFNCPTLCMTPTGYHVLRAQLKPGAIVTQNNNTSLFVGSSWTNTGSAGSIHGYLKAVLPQTSGGALNLGLIIITRVEFKSRT